MTKKSLVVVVTMSTFIGGAFAQNGGSQAKYKLFPSDQTEIGLHGGFVYTAGDSYSGFVAGPGVGVYVRKALDYTFSLRGDLGYYVAAGKNDKAYNTFPQNSIPANQITEWSTPFFKGSVDLMMSLGNSRLESGRKTVNPYVFFGLGAGQTSGLKVTVGGAEKTEPTTSNIKKAIVFGQLGLGVGFRINDKITLGIEEKLMLPLGARADYLDGIQREERDVPLYTNVRLGFNIGGGNAKDGKKVAPLWWASPADQINADIAALNARPKYDPTDTDGDGVIDAFDQEKDTPNGARVDTRGVALDSDADNLPDYKDKEPFSPPGYKVDGNGVAQVPKPAYLTQPEVDKLIDDKLNKFKATMPAPQSTTTTSSMASWFLPIIHFDLDKSAIKESEISNLKSVANVLAENPGVRVLVTGYTDKSAADGYNQGLSYRRAQASIDYLVKNFGVDRSRLVLNYSGEENVLVKTNAQNFVNRRVEFKVAQSESEMSAPAKSVKSKKYKGNKGGY